MCVNSYIWKVGMMMRNIKIWVYSLLCIFLICSLFVIVGNCLETFGYEDKGVLDTTSVNFIMGSWFSCPQNGTADSITVYIKQEVTDGKIKCAIYKRADNTLVGYTEEWTVSIGWDDWKTLDIVSGGELEALDYYLVLWQNKGNRFYLDAEDGKGGYQSRAYNVFPNPWTPTPWGQKVSIYCTYSVATPIPFKLFGAGFNESVPYVELHWSYDDLELVDFFEVQNSTDGIVWDVSGYNTSTQYIDYQVVNGTERYYRVRACKEQDGWRNSSWIQNFETVYFLKGSGGSINISYVGGSWYNYNVSSVHVVRGTYVSGNLASMEDDDLDYYRVDEVVGIEGYDVRLNFTNIPDTVISLSVRELCEYEGNPAHDVDIEVWNFTASAWFKLLDMPEHDFQWNNASISLISTHFINSGNVWIRNVHYTSGVNTHYLNIDYLRLRAFIPVTSVDGGLIWWIGAIFISVPILLVLVYVLRRK